MSRSRFRADLSPPEMASRIQLACEDHRLSCRGSAGRLRRLRPDPESQRSDPRRFPAGRHCRSDRGYRCRSPGVTRRRTRCPRWPRDAGIVDQRQPHADHRFFTGSLGRADYVCELRGQQHRFKRADTQCRRRRTPEPDDAAGNGLDGIDPIARPNRLPPRLATVSHSAAVGRSAAEWRRARLRLRRRRLKHPRRPHPLQRPRWRCLRHPRRRHLQRCWRRYRQRRQCPRGR